MIQGLPTNSELKNILEMAQAKATVCMRCVLLLPSYVLLLPSCDGKLHIVAVSEAANDLQRAIEGQPAAIFVHSNQR